MSFAPTKKSPAKKPRPSKERLDTEEGPTHEEIRMTDSMRKEMQQMEKLLSEVSLN